MSDIKNWNIAVRGVAFDPETGESFQLNETAKLIMSLARQGSTTEAITAEVSKRFGISYETALTDVLEFMVHLDSLSNAA